MSAEPKHTYEYDFDPQSDHAGAQVARIIGPGQRVLEVGAGPGSITRLLVNGLQCQVSAIEIDPSAIEKLRQWCGDIRPLNLNSAGWQHAYPADQRFDAVLAADVLEHLQDPLQTLKGMAELLRPGGRVVISLPHLGFHGVVASLLHGDFDYRDWGVLDRTHVRFFGIDGLQRLFDDAGLAVVEAGFVVRRPERTEFAASWAALPAPMREQLGAVPLGFVYQFIVSAQRVGEATSPTVSLRSQLFKVGVALQQQPSVGVRDHVAAWARRHLSSSQKAWVKRLLPGRK